MTEPAQLARVLQAGAAKPQTVATDGRPFIVVPEGCKVADLSRFLPSPPVADTSISCTSETSFLAFVTKYRTVDLVIFAKPREDSMTFDLLGILDFHKPAPDGVVPANCAFRIAMPKARTDFVKKLAETFLVVHGELLEPESQNRIHTAL